MYNAIWKDKNEWEVVLVRKLNPHVYWTIYQPRIHFDDFCAKVFDVTQKHSHTHTYHTYSHPQKVQAEKRERMAKIENYEKSQFQKAVI